MTLNKYIDQILSLPPTIINATSRTPVLPQEVFDEMICQLTDNKTLKSCSHVCRSFRHSAQKILFHSIDVALSNTRDDDNGPFNLVLIVEQARHLIEYIQRLQIYGNTRPLNVAHATGLANTLGVFSRKGESFPINLRSLVLDSLSWRFIPPPGLQDALVLLMTVHSLRDIDLDGVEDCPANLVQNLPPLLKHLTLAGTTFSSLPTTRKELPKLESLTIVLYDPLAGTRGVHCEHDSAGDFQRDFMQIIFHAIVCTDPATYIQFAQTLNIGAIRLSNMLLPDITDLDSVSIDLNRFSHLTDITINHCCHVDISLIPPVLIVITKTMKKISHRNVVQSLSFNLFLGMGIDIVRISHEGCVARSGQDLYYTSTSIVEIIPWNNVYCGINSAHV